MDDTTALDAEARAALAADGPGKIRSSETRVRKALRDVLDALAAARTENERLTALLGSTIRMGNERADERDEARAALTRREAQITEALETLDAANNDRPTWVNAVRAFHILSATPNPDAEGNKP